MAPRPTSMVTLVFLPFLSSVTVSETSVGPCAAKVNSGFFLSEVVVPNFHSQATTSPSSSVERSENCTGSPATTFSGDHEKSATGRMLLSTTRMVFSNDDFFAPRSEVTVSLMTYSPAWS